MTSFDALHAPLVVDSYELEGEVLAAGVADELLEGVEALGVVAIGVLPGPLRKVLGVERPFLRPADFDGMRVGLNRSQVGSASRALGAMPVTVPAASTWWVRSMGSSSTSHRSTATPTTTPPNT